MEYQEAKNNSLNLDVCLRNDGSKMNFWTIALFITDGYVSKTVCSCRFSSS